MFNKNIRTILNKNKVNIIKCINYLLTIANLNMYCTYSKILIITRVRIFIKYFKKENVL